MHNEENIDQRAPFCAEYSTAQDSLKVAIDDDQAGFTPALLGQARLRRVFKVGDRVQVRDPKGRLHTITLVKNGLFQTNRGDLHHNDVLGRTDGQVISTPEGRQFQVLRPLLADYVMSMPRGATIVYPKDAGTIIHYGDIFEGATVLEAGVGSGALSMSLLGAVGKSGHLISVERRAEFADIARANVDLWFGGRHPAWDMRVGELSDVAWQLEAGSVDRVVLDMLAPWDNIDAIEHVLMPGGVLICYVATVTQLSRLVEDLRGTHRFTDPLAWETTEREWHVQGLAVRPEHRMVGHTGFLVRTRLLAQDSTPQRLVGRTLKDAEGDGGQWDQVEEWSEEKVDIRTSSTKKVRRVRRDVLAKARTWLPAPPSQSKTERTASPMVTSSVDVSLFEKKGRDVEASSATRYPSCGCDESNEDEMGCSPSLSR